jgi:peptide subunit release factor 1 (eRF1)
MVTIMEIFLFTKSYPSVAPKDQISRVAKMLADEYGTASNIKSRVNRLSVLGAITSTQQRLKLYNKGMKILFPVTESTPPGF